ncbi:MAG: sterol desaturase family protein [Rhizomicrobium sp.]
MGPGAWHSDRCAQRKASPRLFQNSLLDRLSRVHHFVPLLLYCPVVVGLLFAASRTVQAIPVLVAFAGGYLLWTLVEYLGHRFLFHYRPATASGLRLQYLIHGVHHAHPDDFLRLVMPPLMSLPIIAAAGTVLRALCGPALFMPALAGFVAGYLAYDMLHFHIHHRRPRSSLERLLRYRHMYHHFRDDSCCYGVSAPWWDVVFGTRPMPGLRSRKSAAAE